MPSTYTTSLRLEKIADGEQNQTWGQTVNRQLDLIDAAIAGVTEINVTGQTLITMATATGLADQARAAVLALSGTLNADCRIVYPAASKLLFVVSSTSGTGRVLLSSTASGGTPFPLGAGEGGLFYSDSLNFNPVGGAFLCVNGIKSFGSASFGNNKATTVANAGFLQTGGSGAGASGAINYSISATSSVVAERFFATSDRRAKTDITPVTAEQGAAWVMAAHPVQYRSASDNRISTGFVAQDQRAAGFGHVVGALSDDEMPTEGEDAGVRLTLDYVQTIAYLTAHAQSLEARLAALEAAHAG